MSNDKTEYSTEDQDRVAKDAPADSKAKSGVATDLWLTLLPYPKDKTKQRMCLRVDREWRHYDTYEPFLWQSVQSVFSHPNGSLEVFVWYKDDEILGLVIRSKYSLSGCDDYDS
jgi:hypothetical protein